MRPYLRDGSGRREGASTRDGMHRLMVSDNVNSGGHMNIILAAMAETEADRFRTEAEECRQMAAKAVSKPDKEGWLNLAAGWLRLAEDAERRQH